MGDPERVCFDQYVSGHLSTLTDLLVPLGARVLAWRGWTAAGTMIQLPHADQFCSYVDLREVDVAIALVAQGAATRVRLVGPA